MHSRSLMSAQPARVEALKTRHAHLSRLIEVEQHSPASSELRLRDLKRKKLQLKDQIEGIRDTH
jgi:hypothetical protein